MIHIVTDSAADLPADILKEHNIHVVPLTVKIDGVEYRERIDLSPLEFQQKMLSSRELPVTSQPSPYNFFNVFQELSKKGQVLCLTLSSKLSGTFQSACVAKNMLGEKVKVYDTLAGSLGQGIQVIKAAKWAAEGLSIDEIIKRLDAVRREMNILILLDTLENIVKGGRLSKFQGSLAKVLDIKVILHAVEGAVEVLEKVRGKKRFLMRAVEVISERGKDFSEKIFGITHLDNEEDANFLKGVIEERFNPKEVIVGPMGSTMGTYAGKGGIIISFG